MFDMKKTIELIKGAVFDPEVTWDRYMPEAGDWKKTALLLTGPLVFGSGVLAYVLSLVFPSRIPFFPGRTFTGMILGIVFSAVAAGVIALVFAFLAGLFKGKNSFPLALAATTLAFVPGYIGQAFMPIPWLGGLLSVVLGIYGLVLLWRILPRYLGVPDTSRTGHYLLSLAGSVAVLLVLGSVLGASAVGGRGFRPDFSEVGVLSSNGSDSPSPNIFGGLERQGKLMEAADNDTYEPPGNGKLSRAQVQNYVNVLTKTRDYRESQSRAIEELGKKTEQNLAESWSEAISGMKGVVNMTTAEMEVVKTGGGNWAEHQWIKEQLRVARIQKDINAAVKHNYELYLEFQEPLEQLGMW